MPQRGKGVIIPAEAQRVVFGKHESNTLEQFDAIMENAERGALMADGHLGYIMPIGGVAAYRNQVSICGVGYDIGCGNMAVRVAASHEDVYRHLDQILDEIQAQISFGIGRKNKGEVSAEWRDLWGNVAAPHWEVYDRHVREELRKLAHDQFGTVGSGNHYIDLLVDEENRVWIANHFGSRGLGHKTATGFLNLALSGKWEGRAREQEVLLDLDSELGERYFRAMQLCGHYASIARSWVCHKVADILQTRTKEEIHNHHNFAWKEEHFGEEYVVVRKGATPAFPGQRGFVGGSMGDFAAIVEGVDTPLSQHALYSTVHGAGRIMGRRRAAGKFKWMKVEGSEEKQYVQVSEGEISREMMNERLRRAGVKLRGGGTDESPHVYRRLSEVLSAQGSTIKVVHELRPIGVVMAGENEFDPYKD